MYPAPTEDPASLRHVAQELRSGAAEIAALNDEVRRVAHGFVYEGPAAVRFKDVIDAAHCDIACQAGNFNQLSGRVERLAAEAEQAWRLWREQQQCQ